MNPSASEAPDRRRAHLDRQLQLTDRLIDRIIYRLYGLTDEEVAVVEEYVG